MGKGFEQVDNYNKAVLQFLNIDNIHVIRGCLEKLTELCKTDVYDSSLLT
jgi:hypothetical protein